MLRAVTAAVKKIYGNEEYADVPTSCTSLGSKPGKRRWKIIGMVFKAQPIDPQMRIVLQDLRRPIPVVCVIRGKNAFGTSAKLC